MFDILAIDWGSLRIGMAFGNAKTGLVLPFSKVLNWQNFWQILQIEIKTRQIEKIIVGMPTNFALGKTETGLKIEEFVKELRKKLEIWQKEENNLAKRLDYFAEFEETLTENEQNSQKNLEITKKTKNKEISQTLDKIQIDFPKIFTKINFQIPIILVNERNSTKNSQKIQFNGEINSHFNSPLNSLFDLEKFPKNFKKYSKESLDGFVNSYKLDQFTQNKMKASKITSKTLSKKNFQNEQKSQKSFQKNHKPNKIQTNHLAASQILTIYFTSLKS